MAESTSIKMTEGLKARLKVIAEDDERTLNWLMNDALMDYADRRERRKAYLTEMEQAHREYVEGGRLHLTQDEVKEWMKQRRTDPGAPMPKLHP